MTSKELIINAFDWKPVDRIPVSPHWWGMYKFELSDIAHSFNEEYKTWKFNGEALAKIDDKFYNTFKPDMLHLSGGCRKEPFDKKWIDYREELCIAMRRFDSLSIIDEFVKHVSFSKEEILDSGIYDHVKIHVKNYPDVFISLNEGNPIGSVIDPHGYIGFEEGLIALIEKPKFMEYLIFSLYDAYIPQMMALKECGADGYIGSETMCSTDLISPSVYRDLIFNAQKHFYNAIENFGLTPIAYFTGDIMPLLDDIAQLGCKAVMVEEPKKTANLNIGEIHRKLYGKVAQFGNIDSIHDLLLGSYDHIFDRVIEQLNQVSGKGFILSCGSPLAFQTPAENIHALRDAANYYVNKSNRNRGISYE